VLKVSFVARDPQQTSDRLLSNSGKVQELPICSGALEGTGLFRPLVA
jgi:hypothetical protein